jgi:hypothetical protein
MRTLFLTIAIILLATTAYVGSSNWRSHIRVCDGNVACMKEQAKAYDLWTGQAWDKDLKESADLPEHFTKGGTK